MNNKEQVAVAGSLTCSMSPGLWNSVSRELVAIRIKRGDLILNVIYRCDTSLVSSLLRILFPFPPLLASRVGTKQTLHPQILLIYHKLFR